MALKYGAELILLAVAEEFSAVLNADVRAYAQLEHIEAPSELASTQADSCGNRSGCLSS